LFWYAQVVGYEIAEGPLVAHHQDVRVARLAPIPGFAVSASAERRAGSDAFLSEEVPDIESFTAPSLSAQSPEVVSETSCFGLNVAPAAIGHRIVLLRMSGFLRENSRLNRILF
jgi:hypothetical protein